MKGMLVFVRETKPPKTQGPLGDLIFKYQTDGKINR